MGGLSVFAIEFARIKARKEGLTLYDSPPMTKSGIRIVSNDETFDIFFSYKSENVDIVRQIAEQLLACGIKVWFAEYLVLLNNWGDFQAAITVGIQQSKYAVLFTNDLYAQSKYCMDEMSQILDPNIMCQDNVLNVSLLCEPLSYQLFPQLKNVKTIRSQGDVAGIVRFIQDNTRLTIQCNISNSSTAKKNRVAFSSRKIRFELDIAGWSVEDKSQVREKGDEVEWPNYQQKIDQHRWVWNVYAGDVTNRRLFSSEKPVDDRAIFHHSMSIAGLYTNTLSSKERGLHLFFNHGQSYLAITSNIAGVWIRKYSILLPKPNERGEFTELVFTCGCHGPFNEFCRHIYKFDNLVASLRWPPGKP